MNFVSQGQSNISEKEVPVQNCGIMPEKALEIVDCDHQTQGELTQWSEWSGPVQKMHCIFLIYILKMIISHQATFLTGNSTIKTC